MGIASRNYCPSILLACRRNSSWKEAGACSVQQIILRVYVSSGHPADDTGHPAAAVTTVPLTLSRQRSSRPVSMGPGFPGSPAICNRRMTAGFSPRLARVHFITFLATASGRGLGVWRMLPPSPPQRTAPFSIKQQNQSPIKESHHANQNPSMGGSAVLRGAQLRKAQLWSSCNHPNDLKLKTDISTARGGIL